MYELTQIVVVTEGSGEGCHATVVSIAEDYRVSVYLFLLEMKPWSDAVAQMYLALERGVRLIEHL